MIYFLQLVDKKDIALSKDEAVVLKQALVSGKVPKYVEIGDHLINSAQIMGIFADEGDKENDNLRLAEPKPTPEQLENREKYLSMLRLKWGIKKWN